MATSVARDGVAGMEDVPEGHPSHSLHHRSINNPVCTSPRLLSVNPYSAPAPADPAQVFPNTNLVRWQGCTATTPALGIRTHHECVSRSHPICSRALGNVSEPPHWVACPGPGSAQSRQSVTSFLSGPLHRLSLLRLVPWLPSPLVLGHCSVPLPANPAPFSLPGPSHWGARRAILLPSSATPSSLPGSRRQDQTRGHGSPETAFQNMSLCGLRFAFLQILPRRVWGRSCWGTLDVGQDLTLGTADTQGVLYIVGCLAASLASIHQVTEVPHP